MVYFDIISMRKPDGYSGVTTGEESPDSSENAGRRGNAPNSNVGCSVKRKLMETDPEPTGFESHRDEHFPKTLVTENE